MPEQETILDTQVITADGPAIAEAARILSGGGLVAFPTETVYGLAADATNGAAVARLYAAKGRPTFNPLIVHVADPAAARRLGTFDAAASTLAATFWPGPLTLVLPKTDHCPVAELATAGLDTVAVRVPAHPVAHALIVAAGGPLVAPSANRSGHVSPTTSAHVAADLGGRIDLILDAGPTPIGVESTIVACLSEGPVLLRPGGLARATRSGRRCPLAPRRPLRCSTSRLPLTWSKRPRTSSPICVPSIVPAGAPSRPCRCRARDWARRSTIG